MFGSIWDRKAEPGSRRPGTTASAESDAGSGRSTGEPRAAATGVVSGMAPSSSAPRRRAIVSASPTGVPVGKQFDAVKRYAPGATVSDRQEPDAMANKEAQRLVVGARIHLKGEVRKCDALIVEGHVEGLASSRVIQVAKEGTFDGEAEAEVVEISGTFDGTLTVSDKLIVRSTGRVSGTIRYCGIEIEGGGQISGDVQVTTEERAPVSKPASESVYRGEGARDVDLAS